jgi:hypothetical protein
MHQKKYRELSTRLPGALWVLMLTLVSYSQLSAQTLTSSPYSRYGLGELQERSLAPQAGMGGLGYALINDTTSPYFINISNPASYTGLRLTTFDAAVRSNTYRLLSNDASVITNNTSLGYVTLGFPIGKRWGGSFGLLPFSSVGYNITDSDSNDFQQLEKFSYEGSGGYNQFYLGTAARVLPSRMLRKGTDLSIGANASYIFGNVNNIRRVVYSAPNSFNTRITESTSLGDFTADLGLQYSFTVDSLKRHHSDSLHAANSMKRDIEDVKFIFGLTLGVPSELNAKRSDLVQSYTLSGYGIEQYRDTIINNVDVPGIIKLPLTVGAGFAVKKGERLLVGIDYTMQQWSQLEVFGENPNLKNSMTVTLGGRYIPNKSADTKNSYFNRVQYRAGLQYKQASLELKNTRIDEYSLSIGAGFPLRLVKVGAQYTHSMVNISLQVGQRGTLENNLIKEQFVRGLVSFTLNDRWFIPRKFD